MRNRDYSNNSEVYVGGVNVWEKAKNVCENEDWCGRMN